MSSWYGSIWRLGYSEEELDELYEDGMVDECGNLINHSTIIGYKRR